MNRVKNVAIVSLSSGMLGEAFMDASRKIGEKRLKDMGLSLRYMPNALKGIEYTAAHPEKRAEDLLAALRDPDIDMILCAIGGDDTYRLLPALFDGGELQKAACNKIFLGFSDTTINHFMLHKAGMRTFYGQSFISDICELDKDMLPYTRRFFEELVRTGGITEITPSDIWYESREINGGFGDDQIGVPHPSHPNAEFELLQGSGVFSGKILGGCIESIHDMFVGDRYADMPVLCGKYELFPTLDDWRGRILLLESSEEKMTPAQYKKAIEVIKATGVFGAVNGVIVGKPMDEAYDDEYRRILVDTIADPTLPILCNISVGHGLPRCIIPFGVNATVDAEKQRITFDM